MATVIVTGSNKGLGLQISLAFARAGDRVIACVRDIQNATELVDIAKSENLDIQLRLLDVSEPDTFASFVEDIVAQNQSIDVLVNNAGIIRTGACEDLSEATLREVMETNFFGAMLLTKAVLPIMRKQERGKIIMISSLSGVAGLAGDVFYSASKFALEGATEALRHEVSRWGIDVALVEAAQYATSLFETSFKQEKPSSPAYPENSVYLPLIKAQENKIRKSLPNSDRGETLGQLIVQVARSDGTQLRWQADDLARQVVSTVLGQSDSERDAYLREAAQVNWWIDGKDSPEQE